MLVAAVTFVLTALLSFWWFSPPPVPRVLRSVEITRSGRVEGGARIVVDGGRLLYLEREGHRWNLVQTSVSGGEAEPVPAPFENTRNTRILDLSPDRSEFLVGSFVSLATEMPLWIMPVAGGSPRRVGEITVADAMWYPGGQRILYAKGSDLWVAERDGSQARKFVSTGGSPWSFAWSPDHRVLRFTLTDLGKDSQSLWEVAADGTHLHPVLPGWSNPCCGGWTPDGRYFLFSAKRGGSSNVWAIREAPSLFRQRPEPVQLTTGPTELSVGVLDGEGKRLFVFGKQPQVEIVQYNAKSRQFLPYLPGTKAWSLSFSRDGQWVAYDAAGALWRSRADGTARHGCS